MNENRITCETIGLTQYATCISLDSSAYIPNLYPHKQGMSMPVAAVQSLVEFIHRSQGRLNMPNPPFLTSTTSEFVVMAQDIAQVLKSSARNPVPLECHQNLINLGTKFVEKAASCRESIAELGKPFIRDDSVSNPIILSRVYMTEARPINSDYRTAVHLSHADIPCTVVLNFTVVTDFDLVGVEGVVENDSLINQIGSYQISTIAKAARKPFYAVAESHKPVPTNPWVDCTPPSFITLLITDLGVLTPSGVSDELIKLYY
ncbi:hypothetical protein BJ085DRAFT_43459 [Dimargaris cristalligena]|uniref:Translation initiation factor eIF2B subunit alpha n=1 Tax=Dimargaris cristalligena TaxID=215637 RepID=A0A4V1J489_9FUNG|nr:hypothetical protein BJ085DRAFT_43459 [Dimargaris cristalligena]|eukprot:RKP34719.1 hypothetical protein BJ085DRAFT_43459 [Dimargaris cristalligena]